MYLETQFPKAEAPEFLPFRGNLWQEEHHQELICQCMARTRAQCLHYHQGMRRSCFADDACGRLRYQVRYDSQPNPASQLVWLGIRRVMCRRRYDKASVVPRSNISAGIAHKSHIGDGRLLSWDGQKIATHCPSKLPKENFITRQPCIRTTSLTQ